MSLREWNAYLKESCFWEGHREQGDGGMDYPSLRSISPEAHDLNTAPEVLVVYKALRLSLLLARTNPCWLAQTTELSTREFKCLTASAGTSLPVVARMFDSMTFRGGILRVGAVLRACLCRANRCRGCECMRSTGRASFSRDRGV
jgi:hypothetical protein